MNGGGGVNGTNNKFQVNGVDPLFKNAVSDNYHLLPASPARDMGDNSVNSLPNDLSGSLRILNNIIDMGPIEFQDIVCGSYSKVVYVDSSAWQVQIMVLHGQMRLQILQDGLTAVKCGIDTD